jgi:hypothetical protein
LIRWNSSCIWEGNIKGTEEKENSNFDSHTFQEEINFFKYLPYWKDLETCHNVDLIHVIKNVFENIIGTLPDMPSKTKNGLKSRNDLIQFGLRPELHPKLRPNEKHYLSPASYSLTVEEKKHSINACVGCEYTHVSRPTLAN